MVYQWKQAGRIKLDAQIVGERLEKIRKKHGELTPPIVVADAADKTSPLHVAFEWNDRMAARRWREEQARYIIRMIVVRTSDDEDDPSTVRAFVSIRDEEDDRSFTSIHLAMADPDLRQQILAECRKDLQEVREKYKDLMEFSAVWEAMEVVKV